MKNRDDEIKLSKEDMQIVVKELRIYFEENFEEEIGNLQSEMLIEFILKIIGNSIYNMAIEEAIHFMKEKSDDMYGIMK